MIHNFKVGDKVVFVDTTEPQNEFEYEYKRARNYFTLGNTYKVLYSCNSFIKLEVEYGNDWNVNPKQFILASKYNKNNNIIKPMTEKLILPLQKGKNLTQLGIATTSGTIFIGVREDNKGVKYILYKDNNTTKPLFYKLETDGVTPYGRAIGVRLSSLAIFEEEDKIETKEFNIGDTVKIVKNTTSDYTNFSKFKLGDTFVIKDFNDNGLFARPTQGVADGVHINLLELVKGNELEKIFGPEEVTTLPGTKDYLIVGFSKNTRDEITKLEKIYNIHMEVNLTHQQDLALVIRDGEYDGYSDIEFFDKTSEYNNYPRIQLNTIIGVEGTPIQKKEIKTIINQKIDISNYNWEELYKLTNSDMFDIKIEGLEGSHKIMNGVLVGMRDYAIVSDNIQFAGSNQTYERYSGLNYARVINKGKTPYSEKKYKFLYLKKEEKVVEEKIETKSFTLTPKTTKPELIAELEARGNRIEKSIEVYKQQEKEKKDLTSKLTSIELELSKVIETNKLLEKSMTEKDLEILNLKKKPLLGKRIKKSKKGNAWTNIIISNSLYEKLNFSYNKNLPLLLKGPAGVGKSSFIKALAEEKGVQLVQFNFNGDTTVEHLLGHKVLIGDPTNPMTFEDGPLTRAVRLGQVFLGDELNASNPEIQFILNGLLEHKNGKLGKLSVQGNNGEEIIPHPNFRFFGTYNPGYLGTKSFGTSLMSRFIGLEIKPLSPDKELELLSSKFPKVDKILIEKLIELETQLRKEPNVGYDISTRDLVQCLEMLDYGFSIVDSVITSIGGALQLEIEQKFLIQYSKEVFSEVEWEKKDNPEEILFE